MELVRNLALSFADDGKRVKVPSTSIRLIYIFETAVCISLPVSCRFVCKGLWDKEH